MLLVTDLRSVRDPEDKVRGQKLTDRHEKSRTDQRGFSKAVKTSKSWMGALCV